MIVLKAAETKKEDSQKCSALCCDLHVRFKFLVCVFSSSYTFPCTCVLAWMTCSLSFDFLCDPVVFSTLPRDWLQ